MEQVLKPERTAPKSWISFHPRQVHKRLCEINRAKSGLPIEYLHRNPSKAKNPIAQNTEYLDFSKLRWHPQYLVEAVRDIKTHIKNIIEGNLLEKERNTRRKLNTNLINFDSVIRQIQDFEQLISKAELPATLLRDNGRTKFLKEIATQVHAQLSDFKSEYFNSPRLSKLVSDYTHSQEGQKLSSEKKVLVNYLRNQFQRNGANLPNKLRHKLLQYKHKLSTLMENFRNNVLNSKFEILISKEDELSGLPDYLKKIALDKADKMRTLLEAKFYSVSKKKKEAKEKALEIIPKNSWLFNLDSDIYWETLLWSDNKKLRKELFKAFYSRGTAQSSGGLLNPEPGQFDNRNIIQEILKTRLKIAKLLGYKSFWDYSHDGLFSNNADRINKFIDILSKRIKVDALKDYKALLKFSKELGSEKLDLDNGTIKPWDLLFLSSHFMERFKLNQNDFGCSFTVNNLLQGTEKLLARLFGLSLKEVVDKKIKWDPDIRVFEVYDKSKKLGTIFFDLFTRKEKTSGAAMHDIKLGGIALNSEKQLPQVCLSLEIEKEKGKEKFKSRVTHQQLGFFLHELGHCLTSLLADGKNIYTSGSYLEQEVVEVSSILFEKLALEKEVLELFTDGTVSDQEMKKVKAGNQIFRALNAELLLNKANYDRTIHSIQNAKSIKQASTMFKDIAADRTMPLIQDPNISLPASFEEIFGNYQYESKYYTYLYSEMLASIMLSSMKEGNQLQLNRSTGKRLRSKYYKPGNSKDHIQLIKDFVGKRRLDMRTYLSSFKSIA